MKEGFAHVVDCRGDRLSEAAMGVQVRPVAGARLVAIGGRVLAARTLGEADGSSEASLATKTKKPAPAKASSGTKAAKIEAAKIEAAKTKAAKSRSSRRPKRGAPSIVTKPALPPFPAPIFLLAPPRSFTSVMCGMIGQHPELLGSPELNLFLVQTMGRFLRLGRMHTGVKRLIAQLYAGEQTIESIVMARNFLFARRDLTTADVHRELCAKIAPRALVQKSPRYHRRVRMMEAILHAFPDARFIHVLRHPRGMCQSYLDLYDPSGPLLATAVGAVDRSGPEPVADPQILWHDYNLRILHFQKQVHPSRWLRVTGEDFLADMDAQLKSLCHWLGVSDSPEAIAAMKRPEESPFASFGPINAMFGNDPKFMQDPVLRPYKRRAQSLTDPLPWRPDGAAFHPRVVEMANGFGYM